MPIPLISVPMSPVSIVSISPNQSDQPSPICSSLLRQFELLAPPDKRVEIPCPYSCAMIPLSKSPSSCTRFPELCSVPLITVDASKALIIASPSICETMTAGIPIPGSFPPMVIGAPGTLFTIMTATAPAASAVSTFKINEQVPRLIIAIFPFKPPGFIKASQASSLSPKSSSTKVKSAVIGEVGTEGPKPA